MNKVTLHTKIVSLGLVAWVTASLAGQVGQEKLDQAIAEYHTLSQQIAEAKAPLAKGVNDKRVKVAQLRSEADALLLYRSEFDNTAEKNRAAKDALSKQVDYIEALIFEHNSDFENVLGPAEDQRYREELNSIRKEITQNPSLESRLGILELSLKRVEDTLKDSHFKGRAIADDGTIVEGQFVSLGPATYFASGDLQTFGQAVLATNSLLPEIAQVPSLSPQAIQSIAQGQSKILPLDPSLGKAREVENAQWTLREQIEKGGNVGYIIIGFAAVALLVAIIKSLQFLRTRRLDTTQFHDVLVALENEDKKQAEELVQQRSAAAKPLLRSVINHHNAGKEVLEERILGQLEFAKRRLESALPILAITAATAPLLGLLGTVVGMIKTFALINVYGSGEAKAFSAGISEALVTTEFGLIVAIPALIIHGVLQRAAKRRLGELEDLSADILIAVLQDKQTQT